MGIRKTPADGGTERRERRKGVRLWGLRRWTSRLRPAGRPRLRRRGRVRVRGLLRLPEPRSGPRWRPGPAVVAVALWLAGTSGGLAASAAVVADGSSDGGGRGLVAADARGGAHGAHEGRTGSGAHAGVHRFAVPRGLTGVRPVPGGPEQVLRGFRPPEVRWAAGHRGVDLAARPGTPVSSALDGRVVFAGRVGGGWTVSVEHPSLAPADGGPVPRTTYGPVRPIVRKGQEVRAGEVVGVLLPDTRAHCPRSANADCLHWGLRTGADRTGQEYADPLTLLGPPRTRLYPP